MIEPIIRVDGLSYEYPKSDNSLLNINNLELAKKEHLFVEGPSGAGKTTMLNLLTGVLRYSSGSIRVLGKELKEFSPKKMDSFRADHMGVIFQFFNLIPYLNVMENILLPCSFSNLKRSKVERHSKELKNEALRLADSLGLGDLNLDKTSVSNLSVGQQQRVAAARALIGSPELIIADEPTSALDQKSTDQFMSLLIEECEKHESNLIFVSHDHSLKRYFNKSILIASQSS